MQYLQNRKQDCTPDGLMIKAKYGHIYSVSNLWAAHAGGEEWAQSYFWAGILSRRSKADSKEFLDKVGGRYLSQDEKAELDQKIAAWEPEPIPDHVRQALEDLKARAENGDAKSQFDWGIELMVPEEYWTGYIVAQDIPQAITLWKQSATQGYGLAQIELGHAYARGWGVAQDRDEALKWYGMAAKGYSEARDGIRNLKALT